MRKKITLIGSGNVGQIVALRLAEMDIADIVLIGGVHMGRTAGRALDLAEAAPIERYHKRLVGYTGEFAAMKDSDIVVISAGIPRRPGMSRDDLLGMNTAIVRMVSEKVRELAPDSIVIMVTNPLDAMCHVAYDATGFPRHRVIGMAGVLDSARFATFIGMELNVSIENIQAFVLGGHGDSMVPLTRYTTVAGIPICELLSEQQIDALVERTRKGGAEIVNLMKTGSAYFAPACAVKEIVEAIIRDKKKILPCSAYLEGEYGITGTFVGVPVKLGEEGIEEIVEIDLSAEEHDALVSSADSVSVLVEQIRVMEDVKETIVPLAINMKDQKVHSSL
ncbi:MAG: malate dehydrogenase [Deltaproteobacteria bacterium]|nr:malate dehydrogenase [Deltaproteobacteria bacterium]